MNGHLYHLLEKTNKNKKKKRVRGAEVEPLHSRTCPLAKEEAAAFQWVALAVCESISSGGEAKLSTAAEITFEYLLSIKIKSCLVGEFFWI